MVHITDPRVEVTAGRTKRRNQKVSKIVLNRIIKNLLKADEQAKFLGMGIRLDGNKVELWKDGVIHAIVQIERGM